MKIEISRVFDGEVKKSYLWAKISQTKNGLVLHYDDSAQFEGMAKLQNFVNRNTNKNKKWTFQ